jgi:hypothetical protein
MRQIVTDSKRYLRLCHFAGLPIGHVPRGLACAFRKILESDGTITATATGEPCPSFPLWPAPNATGGGAVIPCDYKIHTNEQKDFELLTDALNLMPEKEAMKINLINNN